ncbi:amidohydrolase family protein [Paraburkholderia sp. D1E]|uniref:amidohydrolase family protein n=1 Tax=Paraburkholderia sp. D1E TaxID=3461398 RepID=UPI0040461049
MMEATEDQWVDAHFHIFNRRRLGYSWLDQYSTEVSQLLGDYRALDKDYPPEEFLADSLPSGLTKAIHIEAAFGSDPPEETGWIQSVADQQSIPLAIIGHADLTSPDVESVLDRHCAFPSFRGVRRLFAADEASSVTFRKGFAALAERGLIYEVASIWSNCFDSVGKLADDFPDTRIVIEHCGIPMQTDDAYLDEWQRALSRLAERKNVVCKMSGFGMIDHACTPERIRLLVRRMVKAFGADRCFFGSNWPVDSLYMKTYGQIIDTYRNAVAGYSADERRAMLSGNASRVYRI